MYWTFFVFPPMLSQLIVRPWQASYVFMNCLRTRDADVGISTSQDFRCCRAMVAGSCFGKVAFEFVRLQL